VVLGTTRSSGFPIVNSGNANGDDNTLGGSSDLFLARFSNEGTLLHSRYFGGDNADYTDLFVYNRQNNPCNGIAIDLTGNIFITGTAGSDFPTIWPSPAQLWTFTTFSGVSDAFVAAFTPGLELEYCTYLGGISGDHGTDVAVTNADNKHVIAMVGYSRGKDYPTEKENEFSYFNEQFVGGGIDGIISVIRTNDLIVRADDVLFPETFAILSPNPCEDVLFLEMGKQDFKAFTIQIYDMLGRVMLQAPLPEGQGKWNIPVQHLPVGTYNLVLSTSAGTWSGKFVKINR